MKYETSEMLADHVRLDVLKMISQGKCSHIGSAFSSIDILAVLYHDIMKFKIGIPDWPERDRLIFSKGHGGAAVYAMLAESGMFPMDWLMSYCQNGSLLSGHVSHRGVPGVEFSTGSLGHGLPTGCGIAFSLKNAAGSPRTFVILGDGECQEGTTWESALFAAQHQLKNLTVIIDRNHLQGLGRTEQILDLEPLAEKWKSFNWNTTVINGHAHAEIRSALQAGDDSHPNCIIAETIKGYGVSYMEDQLKWHYSTPLNQDYETALAELEARLR